MIMDKLTLYHGSAKAVNVPKADVSGAFDDFGRGFYCTESREEAGEWAVSRGRSGFISTYDADTFELNICDLTGEKFTILNWLAVVMKNRMFRVGTPNITRFLDCLERKFMPDLSDADIIKGYACDDAAFAVVKSFLSGEISYDQLKTLMKGENIKIQYAAVSEKAVSAFSFKGCERADAAVYYPARMMRSERLFDEFIKSKEAKPEEGIFMFDILIEEVEPGDRRL